MTEWFVELSGDSSDLAMLRDGLARDVLVVERPDGFMLTGRRFSAITDATNVRQVATEIATTLSAGAALALNALQPVDIGVIKRRRADGKEDQFVADQG